MSENINEYVSSFTGEEIDELLGLVQGSEDVPGIEKIQEELDKKVSVDTVADEENLGLVKVYPITMRDSYSNQSVYIDDNNVLTVPSVTTLYSGAMSSEDKLRLDSSLVPTVLYDGTKDSGTEDNGTIGIVTLSQNINNFELLLVIVGFRDTISSGSNWVYNPKNGEMIDVGIDVVDVQDKDNNGEFDYFVSTNHRIRYTIQNDTEMKPTVDGGSTAKYTHNSQNSQGWSFETGNIYCKTVIGFASKDNLENWIPIVPEPDASVDV